MLNITKLSSIGANSATACSGSQMPDQRGVVPEALPPETCLPTARQRPVVVWSATAACNLKCAHCPANARPRPASGELTTTEARVMIEDLARFGVTGLIFAGGEPLLRADLPELVACAQGAGLRPALYSNGTVITPTIAEQLRRAGLTQITICLDGIGEVGDFFRGKKGAFQLALAGCRSSAEAGLRVTLQLPLAKRHHAELDSIFDFVERENIPRVCFRHLLYSGRGNHPDDDLSHAQTRRAMDLIWRHAPQIFGGNGTSVFTTANHVDGIYLYLKLLKQDPQRAATFVRELGRKGGGQRGSGVGIAHIDAEGNVHPDPAWQEHSFGNLRQRSFSRIWLDLSDPLMFGLKNRLPLLKGRCAVCQWKPLCGGNMRSRAVAVHGDPWMPDPACYLTSGEQRRDAPWPAEGSDQESQRKKAAA